MLRNELANKTQQYMNTMTILNEKQQELSTERERLVQLERRCFELEKKSEKLATVEEVWNTFIARCKTRRYAFLRSADFICKIKVGI